MDYASRFLLFAQITLAGAQIAGTALIVGVAYGRIMERLRAHDRWRGEVSELLGNGKPGVFIRRREVDRIEKENHGEHHEFRRRLQALEGEA